MKPNTWKTWNNYIHKFSLPCLRSTNRLFLELDNPYMLVLLLGTVFLERITILAVSLRMVIPGHNSNTSPQVPVIFLPAGANMASKTFSSITTLCHMDSLHVPLNVPPAGSVTTAILKF